MLDKKTGTAARYSDLANRFFSMT